MTDVTATMHNMLQRLTYLDAYDNHDIRCGLHSGIPGCCILFYIRGYKWWRVSGMYPEYMRRLRSAEKRHNMKRKWNYIACPQCLKLRYVVRLRKCNCYR